MSPAEAVTASLAPLSRPDLSLTRAPGKPSVALNLAAFGPYGEGEVFEGGELNEILSQLNGPPPKLQLAGTTGRDDLSSKELDAQSDPNRIGPVKHRLSSSEVMHLGKASLDGALMVMPYSDLFDQGPGKGKSADDPGQYIEQVVGALKPGAVLLVVDEKSKPGSSGVDKQKPAGNQSSKVDEFKALGLDFIGSIPAARQPEGDAKKKPSDPAAPAKSGTERVFDLYRKPDPAPGAAVPP